MFDSSFFASIFSPGSSSCGRSRQLVFVLWFLQSLLRWERFPAPVPSASWIPPGLSSGPHFADRNLPARKTSMPGSLPTRNFLVFSYHELDAPLNFILWFRFCFSAGLRALSIFCFRQDRTRATTTAHAFDRAQCRAKSHCQSLCFLGCGF
jgi:hypothetical protein